MPYEGPEEYERFFPSDPASRTYWAPSRQHDPQGIIALRDSKIGVKWPPSYIELGHRDFGDGEPTDRTIIQVTFSTPWGPISRLGEALWPVLTKYDAKALLTWTEEDGNAGFTYLNPANREGESVIEENFGRELEREVEDEDGETHTEIDLELLVERVEAAIDDGDFDP
jgi:hypothetical protein